jgi:hypothetical protein
MYNMLSWSIDGLIRNHNPILFSDSLSLKKEALRSFEMSVTTNRLGLISHILLRPANETPKAVAIGMVELGYGKTVHYFSQMSLQYGSFQIDCSLWVRVIGRRTVQLLSLAGTLSTFSVLVWIYLLYLFLHGLEPTLIYMTILYI